MRPGLTRQFEQPDGTTPMQVLRATHAVLRSHIRCGLVGTEQLFQIRSRLSHAGLRLGWHRWAGIHLLPILPTVCDEGSVLREFESNYDVEVYAGCSGSS